MGRRLLLVGLAGLLVLAGCNAPTTADVRPDPAADQRGWENGYWYDDELSVDASDGLTEREREAVVARTMARVERIRGLEFERSVGVEVISRAEYREQYGGQNETGTDHWREQVWEALLLVGEDTTVSSAFGATFDASVRGFYDPGEEAIVLVSDAETPTVDRWTLAHELVHALQDQQFGLDEYPRTQDRRRGRNGVVEGDANYVAAQYEQRCERSWDCLPRPNRTEDDLAGFDRGVFLTMYAPYAAGESFVASVHDREGWAGVDALYDRYPTSSEQVIHPDAYPDERPRTVTVPDRSNGEWERFDREPVGETVGEAAIYATFWANGQVNRTTHDTYDYDHPLSAGWAGDTVVPYRNGDRYGYVWQTAWDTRADAREFAGAYRAILADRSVTQPTNATYVLPESDPFGDAFRVTREGTRVRVVNAPTVGDLDAVHAPD
ncbi:Hvo_1808 family surface protein [Halorientalis brevis]|uniref:Hvo_1808 family surface protein n=1 Tax=Halorientalis brevis TaxID=1126241 RepID=A0ABD6CD71_9EURY